MSTTTVVPEPSAVMVYSEAEIKAVYAHNPTVRVKIKVGDPKLKCECKCDGYVSAAAHAQGWRWIHGHKNNGSGGTPRHGGMQTFRSGSAIARPVSLKERYESTLGLIEMDLANKEAERARLDKVAIEISCQVSTLREEIIKLQDSKESILALIGTPKG